MDQNDPLVKAYKEQMPGLSDEGAQIQAMLFRAAMSGRYHQTPIMPGAILLTLKREGET